MLIRLRYYFILTVICLLAFSSLAIKEKAFSNDKGDLGDQPDCLKDISVEGILYDSQGKSMAIINGEFFHEDDYVKGLKIEIIEDEHIILSGGESKYSLEVGHATLQEQHSVKKIDKLSASAERRLLKDCENAKDYYKNAESFSSHIGRYRSSVSKVEQLEAIQLILDNYKQAIKTAQKALEGLLRAGEERKAEDMKIIVRNSRKALSKIKTQTSDIKKELKDEINQALRDRKVTIGMTKSQVKKVWGKPQKTTGDAQEEWFYYNPSRRVYFNAQGIVTKYHEY